ncbi:hypothetical protein QFC24_001857 [Naganishia onofrii]|uniref:Uncharacterized protein n=1 Tax=Naganishia onofrii TaxID=1851511 RepID=A0ACC2XTX7_9TREE|nr:hypothetical protein QFC24_001857 [Naganishia onofrii]
MSEISTQPGAVDPMSARPPLKERIMHKVSTKDGWLGDFDFKFLCMPQLPFGNARKHRRAAPFYGLHDDLPLLVTIVIGFQHSLAMIAGLITPPIIFANYLALDASYQSYMISASLISSGILSMIQMSRIHLFKGYYLGCGILCVVGTSFATLPVGFATFDALYADGTCKYTTLADGTKTKAPCPEAFGYLIGTTALCSLTSMILSFVPPKKLQKIFPPLVTGVTVLLIGANLIGDSGALNWAGGSNGCQLRPETGFFSLCPNVAAPKAALWGSPQFMGLGFLSFITIVLLELFGSPFMRNASIILGLLVGCIVAGATGYMTDAQIKSAPAITFLWAKRFPLKIYAPSILPAMAVYIALALEAIGDITASSEVSRLSVDGPDFDSRIQGGVLADGFAGMLSALFTVTPMSIFAQNNGVIALTRCANRRAGFACAMFLILFGVLGKISGVFLSIPNPVLGGVTTFLFASVVTSGIRILSYLKWGRKERFVLAASLTFGMGNMLAPGFLEHLFEGVTTTSKGLTGFLSSITIIVSAPCKLIPHYTRYSGRSLMRECCLKDLSAFVVGCLLWNILPDDPETIVRYDADQTALELGQLDKGERDVPSMAYSQSGKAPSEGEEDDVKAVGAFTRVEPVA